jgi:enoyl-CoA hydratase/carnithine racemase
MLEVSVNDGVALVVLARPEARNALDTDLLIRLRTRLDELDEDVDVHAVVLTGSGQAFCAGLDLRAATADGAEFAQVFRQFDPISRLGDMVTPVIGAVNGAAVTGGLELALACDFLIASDQAFFADTHARLGILPVAGMTARLPARVGPGAARRLSMTGERWSASTALGYGLVTEVVPHSQLRGRALELAGLVAAAPPPTMKALKRQFHNAAAVVLDDALAAEWRVASEGSLDFAGVESRT